MIKKSKEHLDSVNETYTLHFKEAFKISCLMIVGGFQAIIHAILPAVFTTSASDKIKILYDKVSKR
tara:strand:- start:386 stop:583 length:198 start_codon:yes stop_codon:yes gene_type:complete